MKEESPILRRAERDLRISCRRTCDGSDNRASDTRMNSKENGEME